MKRQLICTLLFLSVVAAANAAEQLATTAESMPGNQPQVERFFAQPFSAIDISGPIDVQIKDKEAKPALELMGDANSLSHLYAAVKNGVLYLGVQSGAQQPLNIQVKVSVPQLNQLHYAGSGNVVGENMYGPFTIASNGTGNIVLLGKNFDLQDLKAAGTANIHILGIESHLLNVQDSSSGKINLGGSMVLHNLSYQGTGPLSIEWVNSSDVNVTGSGRGKIFLAGIADQINATLSDHVFMDAKYLHADKGFINTRDNARADVWTKYNLSALATKGSNIYYYHDSQMVGGYMIAPGAVIRMTGLDTINR